MSILRDLIARPAAESRSWGLDGEFPFSMTLNGVSYPVLGLNQSLGAKVEQIDNGFANLVQRAYMGNGIVFACMLARMMLFTEARFQFRRRGNNGQAGDLFGTPALGILEHPWPGAVTGDLLKYLITDHDLAGNAFVARVGSQLVRLRPDWTTIIHGSNDPQGTMWDPDAELLGYGYQPGGPGLGHKVVFYDRTQVAHFATVPDPMATYRGMSWLAPIIRNIMGHQAATEHKLAYFQNGATPNLVIKVAQTDTAKFREWVNLFKQNHEGVANAYKTLYLNPAADATVMGANLQQSDFKVVQGADETVIAAAAGVPAVVVGISEGLQGSSLNAGNFAMSMRRFAELTMRPLWRNVAGSLATIVTPPPGAELWYDDRDISALRVDRKDAADIQFVKAQTIRHYIDGGFVAESAVKAVQNEDPSLLVHTGLFSVQLQAPGSVKMPAGEVPGEGPVGPGPIEPLTLPPGSDSTKPVTGSTQPTNGKTPAAVKAGRALEHLLIERSHDD